MHCWLQMREKLRTVWNGHRKTAEGGYRFRDDRKAVSFYFRQYRTRFLMRALADLERPYFTTQKLLRSRAQIYLKKKQNYICLNQKIMPNELPFSVGYGQHIVLFQYFTPVAIIDDRVIHITGFGNPRNSHSGRTENQGEIQLDGLHIERSSLS